MSLTTDPNDPDLHEKKESGQNKTYLVLSEEERAKGFVRPVRRSYVHKGEQPTFPLRDLTEEEKKRYEHFGYVKFEQYPLDHAAAGEGMFWTEERLRGRCGTVTKMGQELAETYARDPKFYGATFCCGCNRHFPVAEFVWEGTDEKVGS